MLILIIFILSGVFVTFFGYLSHWMFHQKWSGKFFKSHMNHHTIQYPQNDLISDTYRYAGDDSSVMLFVITFIPLLLLLFMLFMFGFISTVTFLVIIPAMIFWGVIHDYFHDQFHLKNSFWLRFQFFKIWRNLHFIHHYGDMEQNYGIICFAWDRLFKTFSNR